MWKPIKGFEDYYEINENGEVRSLGRYVNNNGTKVFRESQIIKPQKDSGGYYQIGFSINGKRYRFMLHKLVAINFIDNPNNLNEVNHIDHNKLNCHVDNLEWVTHKENMVKMAQFYGTQVPKKCKLCQSLFYSKKADNQIYCSKKCSSSDRGRENIPTKEELKELILNKSFVKIGKMYGVSDNAIRKWCAYYELPYRKKDIDKLKNI